jgi:hypothetical protein
MEEIRTRSRLASDEWSRYEYDHCSYGSEVPMRKLVHAIYVSLDGVDDEPSWTGQFFND